MTVPREVLEADRKKSLFIKTYGCQMNVYDSGRMTDILARSGYHTVDRPDQADLIILNTCHIREKATEKVFSELGRLRDLKRAAGENGRMVLLAVAGCVAQAEGAEISARAPYVDMIFGPQTYHRLPEMLARIATSAGRSAEGATIIDTEFPVESKFDHLPEESTAGPGAFLTVQEGCDKFCSFCVVPYTRGAEMSRPAVAVQAEARRLVAAGVHEITLLGQNVNAYHGAGPDGREWGLGRLIRFLAGIDGLDRIRYMTSHPRDMDDDLIAAHGEVPTLMPYLHLPVQSGSDRVLSAMNRKHDRAFYLHLVDRLRCARSDLALSSDFIVGHPGETESDFTDTLRLVETVGYAQAYSFKFSPRPGTPAARLRQLPVAVASERLQRLQQLLGAQQADFNSMSVGTIQPVLVERRGRLPGQMLGRTPYMQAVHVTGPDRVLGTVIDIHIVAAHANSLAGRAVVAGEAVSHSAGSADHRKGTALETDGSRRTSRGHEGGRYRQAFAEV